jgi:peroxiredoxin
MRIRPSTGEAVTAIFDPPREGLLLPGLQLPRAGGGTVRIRAYRGRRALVLIFVHGAACDGCRDYLSGALDAYAAYGDEDAEVVVVAPDGAQSVEAMRAELALPFPVGIDSDGTVARRYGLVAGRDAAVMATDRYGAPRIWRVVGNDHALPEHDALVAEVRYLALTCSGGCSVPIWPDP